MWLALIGLLMLAAPVAAAGRAPLRFGPSTRIDHAMQYVAPHAWDLNGLSCPSPQLCVGVGDPGQVETSVDPASPSSWSGREISPNAAIDGVSCPSVTLCVADTVRGDVLTSTNPRVGPWTRLAGVITGGGVTGGVSCPTAALCVAVIGGSTIAISTDPQAGVWHLTMLSESLQLDSVSCPSVSLCVIADFDGNVVTSTNPTGPASAWKITDLRHNRPTPGGPRTVSCGSANECVIGDNAGDLIVSTAPTGGANAWSVKPVDPGAGNLFVSCLPTLQCVAADDGGHVLRSTNPTSGAQWRTAYVDPSGIFVLTCQSAALCVAADGDAGLMSSVDLGASWTIGPQLGQGAPQRAGIVGLSCPRVSLCVAVDSAGNQLTSVDPASGKWMTHTINRGLYPSGLSCTSSGFCETVGQNSTVASTSAVLSASPSWRLSDLSRYSPGAGHDPNSESLNGVSCPSPALCVATRFDNASNFNLEVSRDPGGPPTSWYGVRIGLAQYDDYQAVSCAGVKLCVAANGYLGKVLISADAARHWRVTPIHGAGAGLSDVSCPSTSFCAAAGKGPQVFTSTDPTGGSSAWHGAVIDPQHSFSGIACASRSLCAAFDGGGRVFVSSDPAGGATTWHETATGQPLSAIACPSTRLCVLATSRGTVLMGKRRY